MANIGIFFGTDTGKTRKIAKMIHKQLGEADAGRRPAAGPRGRGRERVVGRVYPQPRRR